MIIAGAHPPFLDKDHTLPGGVQDVRAILSTQKAARLKVWRQPQPFQVCQLLLRADTGTVKGRT